MSRRRPPAPPDFAPLVGAYLARQDWAQAALSSFGEASVPAEVVDVEVLRAEQPGMASVVVSCRDCTFHLVLGWRSVEVAPGVLGSHPDAVLGPGRSGGVDVLVYAAFADAELVVALLEAVTGGTQLVRRGRVLESLVSHASLAYDDRLFMKCYRVLEPRPRPEVEMVTGLHATGFREMLAPVAHWQRQGRDLALVREFVPGAVEGLALARTSLRDLLARADSPGAEGDTVPDVALAGGDLGPEMRRLGEMTGRMHLALADAFGTVAPASKGGPSRRFIRLHGDYHLRRVMRTDGGWLVAGFGDDPLLGRAAGAASQGEGRFGSPLEDVADLCRSLQLAAGESVALQTRDRRAGASELTGRWCQHNVAAFVGGYLASEGIGRLVGGSRPVVDTAVTELVGARGTR